MTDEFEQHASATIHALKKAVPSERMIEAAARRLFFDLHNIMHDHEKLWRKLGKFDRDRWREIARGALVAALKEASDGNQ